MIKKHLAVPVFCLLLGACAGTPKSSQPAPPTAPETAAKADTAKPEVTRPFPDDSLYDLLVAEFAVRRNRFDLALGNYMQQAHETRDPGVVARATRLAEFLKANNATLDAATLWTEVEPDSMEGQYTLSTALAKQGEPREAFKHMAVVLEHGGRTNFAAIAASALRQDADNRDKLEQDFDNLIKSHPDNAQLLIGKSLLQQQRGNSEQALDTVRKALKLEPENLQAIIVEARLLQQLKRNDEALSRLQQVVKQYPDNRRLRLQYARMLMSKDMGAAKKQFEWLLNTTPDDPDLLLSLGLISREMGQADETTQYFERLLTTGERTDEAHFYLGQLKEGQQQWQQAIDQYRQISPGNDYMAAASRITALYARLGQAPKARQFLQQARRDHPEHSVQLYLLESELLLKDNDLDASRKLLTEALLAHPKQASLLYARAMVNEKSNRFKAMEKDLRAIIAQDPNNAVALNALGYILANRSQNLDEAYRMIRHALDLKPNDPAILDSLGWVEYRRGNKAQALQLLGEAFQSFPDPEVAAHLGEVLWALGEKDQAIAVWQKGLKREPDNPHITETLKRLGVKQPLPATPDAGQDDPAEQ